MITVLKSALQTTVQDQGRRGLRHLGVGAAGPMDRLSFSVANLLVGNPPDAAGLELTLPPARLRFETPCEFALTGADCAARLDDQPVPIGRRIYAAGAQVLHLSAPLHAAIAYLAVAGGLSTPEVMGSRSTDVQARFGGLEGRALRAGDVLTTRAATASAATARAALTAAAATTPSVLLPQLGEQIRILPGPEYDEFEADAREALVAATWIVSTQSNRMAYRLDGPLLKRERGTDLRSHAVFPGVVQVPPGGTPMVLMADAQATGGYPRIASVIAADLGRLAQRRPATALHFALETRAGARVAWQKQQTYLQRLRRSLLQ